MNDLLVRDGHGTRDPGPIGAALGDPDRGRLHPGTCGDLTLVDDELEVVAVVVGGRIVHATAGGPR